MRSFQSGLGEENNTLQGFAHIFLKMFFIYYAVSDPMLLLRFYYTNPLSGETEVERFWATVIPIVPQSW